MNEEEKKKPDVSELKLPNGDLSVHSTRGIPLHTRYTKLNKIQIKTFRNLLWTEVLNNLNIRLDNDVISIIVLYTFEATHAFTAKVKMEESRSLVRDRDILKVLKPLNPDHDPHPTDDYELKELVGRTLYGLDIHDSPYTPVDDPNPCQIMTDQGGIFLVPKAMSNWYLNQDGKCIALPVRYRFKHQIVNATVKSRGTGPYLELTIKPIRGVVPGTDDLLKECESNMTLCDLESAFSYSEINSNLKNYPLEEELVVDDPLAREIAKSYKSTRESVLVVLEQSTLSFGMPEENIEEPFAIDESTEEGNLERQSANMPLPSYIESASTAGISRESPTHKTASQLDTDDEELRERPASSPRRHQHAGGAKKPNQLQLKKNLSLVAHSEATQSVLEIGAGVFGTDIVSRCLLQSSLTTNPLLSDINSGSNFL